MEWQDIIDDIEAPATHSAGWIEITLRGEPLIFMPEDAWRLYNDSTLIAMSVAAYINETCGNQQDNFAQVRELAQLIKRASDVGDELEKKNEQIAGQRKKILQLEHEVAGVRAALDQKTKTVNAQAETIREQRREIGDLSKRIEEQDTEALREFAIEQIREFHDWVQARFFYGEISQKGTRIRILKHINALREWPESVEGDDQPAEDGQYPRYFVVSKSHEIFIPLVIQKSETHRITVTAKGNEKWLTRNKGWEIPPRAYIEVDCETGEQVRDSLPRESPEPPSGEWAAWQLRKGNLVMVKERNHFVFKNSPYRYAHHEGEKRLEYWCCGHQKWLPSSGDLSTIRRYDIWRDATWEPSE